MIGSTMELEFSMWRYVLWKSRKCDSRESGIRKRRFVQTASYEDTASAIEYVLKNQATSCFNLQHPRSYKEVMAPERTTKKR